MASRIQIVSFHERLNNDKVQHLLGAFRARGINAFYTLPSSYLPKDEIWHKVKEGENLDPLIDALDNWVDDEDILLALRKIELEQERNDALDGLVFDFRGIKNGQIPLSLVTIATLAADEDVHNVMFLTDKNSVTDLVLDELNGDDDDPTAPEPEFYFSIDEFLADHTS